MTHLTEAQRILCQQLAEKYSREDVGMHDEARPWAVQDYTAGFSAAVEHLTKEHENEVERLKRTLADYEHECETIKEMRVALTAEQERGRGLVEALKDVVAAKCYDSCAHPQSVWWKEWVQEPAKKALAAYEAHK